MDALVIGGRVSRDLSGKTHVARVRYAKGTTGGLASSIWDTKFSILLPDHTDTDHCVFLGYYPSQTANYGPADNSEEFTGYDYASKLSGQVLPTNLLDLIPLAVPAYYQAMDYKSLTVQFHVGKTIVGGTSGATARVVATPNMIVYSADRTEHYDVALSQLVLSHISGTFQDSETITEIGGTGAAYVDGTLTQVDIYQNDYYPETWLRDVLGDTNWENMTGCNPYRLNSTVTPAGAWTAKPLAPWFFKSAETKQQAIDEICAYHNFIFLVKTVYVDSAYTPCAYFVHQDDIDNATYGLDLPAELYLDATDPSDNIFLVGGVTMDIVGEGRVNKVTIRCQDISGNWYQNERVSGTTESSGVYNETEIATEYFKEDPNLVSQDDCDTAAALLYTYLSQRAVTYRATFRQRTDMELLQLINFSNYTEIPDGEYRIIGIEYTWDAAAVFVTTTLVPVAQFKASLNVTRVYINSTLEVQRIIRAELAKQSAVVVGTVTDISGNAVKATTESGVPVASRQIT